MLKKVDITTELLFSKANKIIFLFVVLVVNLLNRLAIKCLYLFMPMYHVKSYIVYF